MKKCILIGALAALMLFAFTACEQQVPNFIEKTPTAMSVVSTPEYLVGEKADPNQIKVEIVYANGDVETKTAATLGMVATTLNGMQNKVSLSYGTTLDGKPATFEVVVPAYEIESVIIDPTNAEMTTVAKGASPVQFKLDGAKITAIYNGNSQKEVSESLVAATFTNGAFTVDTTGAIGTEAKVSIVAAKQAVVSLSSDWVLEIVDGSYDASTDLKSVSVTQKEDNEVFAINGTLAQVTYDVTGTYADGSTKAITGATLEYVWYETSQPAVAGTYDVVVTVSGKQYPAKLAVSTASDYPTAVTVTAKDTDLSTEGVQPKKYVDGNTVSLDDFTYTATAWASGYKTYGQNGINAPSISSADFEITAGAEIKNGTQIATDTTKTITIEYKLDTVKTVTVNTDHKVTITIAAKAN